MSQDPPKLKTQQKDLIGWGCGCFGLMFLGMVLLGGYFNHVEQEMGRKSYESLQSVEFKPGKASVDEILQVELFKDRRAIDHITIESAQYFEWDHGILMGWFLGDPVEVMILHSNWGPTRLNNFTTLIDPPYAPYPNPEEFEKVLDKIERTYKQNDARLGAGYPLRLLFALERLKDGHPTFGLPPDK